MADIVATTPASAEVSISKKNVKKGAKNTRPKASHPPTAVMVTSAIKSLKERGGSSLQAIKKYISSTYKVDAEKLAPFIKKYIKASVAGGSFVQTKGKGASGSFKLSTGATAKAPSTGTVKVIKKPVAKKATKPKPKVADKPVTAAVAKKTATKRTAKPKRAVVEKKKVVAAAPKPKSPAKAKKVTKAPTKKPKSPKPKSTKTKVAPAKSPRKAPARRK